MRAQSGTIEFVIMSGPEVHDYLVLIRAQLRAYLAASFPDYRFSLVTQSCEGMGFVVVPIVSDDDETDECGLEHSSIGKIRAALEAFRPDASPYH